MAEKAENIKNIFVDILNYKILINELEAKYNHVNDKTTGIVAQLTTIQQSFSKDFTKIQKQIDGFKCLLEDKLPILNNNTGRLDSLSCQLDELQLKVNELCDNFHKKLDNLYSGEKNVKIIENLSRELQKKYEIDLEQTACIEKLNAAYDSINKKLITFENMIRSNYSKCMSQINAKHDLILAQIRSFPNIKLVNEEKPSSKDIKNEIVGIKKQLNQIIKFYQN